MRSKYHNLAQVNGCEQFASLEAAALGAKSSDENGISQITMDIASAYPAQAGMEHFIRTVGLDRGREQVFIQNRIHCKQPSSAGFFFMTAYLPEIRDDSVMVDGSEIHFDSQSLSVEVECLPVTDSRLLPAWGTQVYRIIFSTKQEAREIVADFTIV